MNIMKASESACARCTAKLSERICRNPDGKSLPNCPTRDKQRLLKMSQEAYENPAVSKFARQASIQEAEGYSNRELGYDFVRPAKPRILEIIEFSKKMKYKRIGLAFCAGLTKEAKVVDRLFSSNGFDLTSVICKVGRVPKEAIGIQDDQKIAIGCFESMCNPILQAMVLNDAKTELNVLLGLCVGHDSLFLQHAKAPCTVLAVKDRLLGHNPLAAIYNIDGYYRALK
jgi:uncharacterized metal-binding protein